MGRRSDETTSPGGMNPRLYKKRKGGPPGNFLPVGSAENIISSHVLLFVSIWPKPGYVPSVPTFPSSFGAPGAGIPPSLKARRNDKINGDDKPNGNDNAYAVVTSRCSAPPLSLLSHSLTIP
jgi:hypothetical protein